MVPNQVIYAANFTQGEVLPTVINETLTVRLDLNRAESMNAEAMNPLFLNGLNGCHLPAH